MWFRNELSSLAEVSLYVNDIVRTPTFFTVECKDDNESERIWRKALVVSFDTVHPNMLEGGGKRSENHRKAGGHFETWIRNLCWMRKKGTGHSTRHSFCVKASRLEMIWLWVEAAKMCARSGCVSEAIFETLPKEARWLMRG